MYYNYHKHDYYSNIRTPDVIVSIQDYIDRAKELGHTHIFTTNHGCSANVYETYGLCKKNNMMCVFGMEMYYVDDRFSKENRNNFHIIVIALNSDGMKDINRISSEANKTGFYYHPRIDKSLLLSLNPNNVVVTTACIHNRINHAENGIEEFLIPVHNHFKNHFFLETQSHNHEAQAKWNNDVLLLSEKYDINIIHGCDSHYIYEEQYKDRLEFLNGKGMNYGEENDFVLDYPEYNTIIERYKTQGVLSEEQVIKSINNTFVFDKVEDLMLNDDVKMPTIYKELSVEERYKKLAGIVKNNLANKLKDIDKSKYKEYVDAVKFELDIIKETNTEDIRIADYFLINEKIINRGVNEYDGILTRTGRGSAVSFLTNHLLGFTEIDRLDSEVPLYPTRFISKSRIIETRSMPDIDYNTSSPIPFIKASKDILGEDGCYYMVAYGRMKHSGAFRNLCRSRNIPMEDYNEFGKLISEIEAINDKELKKSKFNEISKDDKFGQIFIDSKKFVGVIDSISPSPCSFLLLDKPISEEIGLIKVGDELCCCIDGYTSDVWKFLKNDILTVTVWDIIDKVYKRINKPIPTIKELRGRLDDDVWKLYEDCITATLNQVDSDFATNLMKKYCAKNPAELTAFVSAIRPSFASLLDGFLNRIDYTTGVDELDNLLASSFRYNLYQENIMAYLTWLGIEEDKTYELIKKISKKKLKQSELEDLEKILHANWISIIGNDEMFAPSWQVVQDAAAYGFNASHALSVAWDSLYGAELKTHYPLDYYSVVLDVYKDNVEKTAKIQGELSYFNIKLNPIKFRYSQSGYSSDEKNNAIYKGISSVKFLNETIADELYALKDNQYETFTDLLIDIKQTSVNARQLKILTTLNFFSEFGKTKKLLQITNVFDNIYSRKQIKIADIDALEIPFELIEKYSETRTEKMFKDIDVIAIIKQMEYNIEDKPLNVKERISCEMEYMGYIDFVHPKASPDIYYVSEFKTFKDKTKPYLQLYQIKTGNTIKAKITSSKIFITTPFKQGDILTINNLVQRPKVKKVGDEWVKSNIEFDNILTEYEVY